MDSITAHALNAIYGGFLACTGCIRGACHPELRHHYKKTLAWITGSLLLLAFLGYLVTLPIHVILWLVGGTTFKAALSNALYKSLAAIPFVLVALCRYFKPTLFDHLFLMGVAMDDPLLAEKLSQIKVDYFTWAYVTSVALFLVHRLVLTLILTLGTIFTPLFGGLFAIFAFGYKIRRMEVVFFCALFGLYVVPWTRSYALDLARIWFDARGIAKELFAPFIDRQYGLDLANKELSILKWPKHQAILFGFSYTLSYFLEFAFVGPLVWFLGSISAGILTNILLRTTVPPAK
ncbi:Aste57867_659 [Aphanomyces stellatus]|uniref:Aste57867_659 protein n=1 Tax=Aphanomyces stellatus TaxID=120398 RepID=A0A485K869_9STRA|nr:hypothetical protein As57867_000658 [Aphanomyces stellatus]VFT77884.1 Aste57867_659 [Aphanomyces stellatus]